MDKLFAFGYLLLFFAYTGAADAERVIVNCNSTKVNTWEHQAHPDDCNSYVTCMNNIGIVQNCPFGYYFNPAIILCDHPENVECESESTTTEGTTPTVTDDTTLPEETTVEGTSTTEQETESTTEDTTIETTTIVETTIETTTTVTDVDTTVETTTDQTTEEQTTTDLTTEDPSTTEQTTAETTTTGNTEDITDDTTTEETASDDDTTTEPPESECEPLCGDLPPWGGESGHPTDCNRFVSCSDQCLGATLFCPPNLHFNHHKLVCDFASRAECLLTVCAGQPDGPMASINSCRHYFVCAGSRAFLQPCGAGLVFDPSVSSCVPENEGNTCEIQDIPPAPPSIVAQCDDTVAMQIFRHPNYCDVHYRCSRGLIFARRCQSGFDFDEVAQVCNLQEIVNCSV